MDELSRLCNDNVILNETLFLNSPWPQVSQCFQKTVLIWVPCAWLWVTLPFYACFLYGYDRETPKIAMNFLSASKSAVSFLLAVLVIIDLTHELDSGKGMFVNLPSLELISSFVLLTTFILAALLSQLERRCGIVSSGVQFVFWLLLMVASVVPFYTYIILQMYHDYAFSFYTFYVYFFFLLVQFFLHCWAEKRSSTHQPLNEKMPSPELDNSVLNRLYFCWMNSIVFKAVHRSLRQNDLWPLNKEDRSETLVPQFVRNWNREVIKSKAIIQKERDKLKRKHEIFTKAARFDEKSPLLASKPHTYQQHKPSVSQSTEILNLHKPSLSKALTKTFGGTYLISLSFKFLSDVLQFVSPILLGILIDYADEKEHVPAWRGYLPAVALFVASCLQSLFYHQNYHIGMTVGMRIKSSLVSAIFKKALTLSPKARRDFTLGEIVNLMSVDCQRIQDTFTYSWSLMTCPLQLTLGIYLLWGVVGPSCLAGLAVLVLLVPLNSYIVVKQRSLNAEVLLLKGKRIKLMNDILNGIKVLKMYAWEMSFQEKVKTIRDKELVILRKVAWLQGSTSFCWILAPFLVTLATFATFVLSSDSNVLDAKKAFVALSLFNILRLPINLMSQTISLIVQASVSIKRIQEFLIKEDLNPAAVHHSESSDYAVEIESGTFTWNTGMSTPTLREINLKVPEGILMAVVGQVGCGKSSLISAMLGEMDKLDGKVNFRGSIAYVPQEAWIQNATLQDNIMFGKPFIQRKYRKVIDACALGPDLEILPGRDQTEIGEKGINISGGQKQRVSLARAVYSNSDVYLMDDPLSAVDSHVGKHIFDRVVGPRGLLKNKTRILVTHGVHWLPMVDMVVVMVNGKISETGSYTQLVKHDGPFSQFLKEYFLQEQETETEGEEDLEIRKIKMKMMEQVESAISDSMTSDTEGRKLSLSNRKEARPSVGQMSRSGSQISDKVSLKRLIVDESSQYGQVKWSVFGEYAKGIGIHASFIVLFIFTCYHSTSVFSNFWLTFWTEDPFLLDINNMVNETEYHDKRNYYLAVYSGLGAVQAVLVFLYAIILSVRMVTAAGRLHHRMLDKILHAPMSFFDTTPVGRIINRFAADMDILDNTLPLTCRITLNSLFLALSTLVVITINTPYFALIIIPTAIVYYLIMKFYVPTVSQLKRIESVTRSPVFNNFSETVTGASVIRAYRVTQRFKEESARRINQNLESYYANLSSSRWLGVRLEFLGNCMVLAATMFSIFSDLNGADVGLSIVYALQATGILNLLVVNFSDVANNIVCVERIKEYYTDVESEAEWYTEKKPPSHWPSFGHITFHGYKTRYRKGLDLVLKGIQLDINHGEKIGIVGRTGAGKSSMTLSLFRLIEATEGDIFVDGIPISSIGLHELRSKITILPQDPVLFSGTLRSNLDPFDDYSDLMVWRALDTAHLKDFVQSLPAKLQYDCGESGSNLSVGQRQLVCLARAVLKKTKILILDEATAAVDFQTDDLIQQTIREEFKECTILSIAHRLNTIMDYDRIIVLDNGLVAEFDTPSNLLDRKDTIFYNMAKNAGLVNGHTKKHSEPAFGKSSLDTEEVKRPKSTSPISVSSEQMDPIPPPRKRTRERQKSGSLSSQDSELTRRPSSGSESSQQSYRTSEVSDGKRSGRETEI